jgi:hypothetical protein
MLIVPIVIGSTVVNRTSLAMRARESTTRCACYPIA